MKKEKIQAFNFIKAICAIGIIIFHFSCHYTGTFRPFYEYKNGDWGSLFVGIFFMISGASLYYNYEDELKITDFYKKRWKSIFPMFYLAYISFELGNMISLKNITYRGSIIPYIYTLLGMDGYLSQNTTTYYILGEWFLGMIIILYILFPLLRCIFKKNDKITFVLITILYLLFLDKPILNPKPYWSITSSLFSFVIGMMIIKYKDKLINIYSLILSIFISAILIFIKLPLSTDLCLHLLALFLLVGFMYIGEKIMKAKSLNIIFTELSNISYAIFLLQHVTILKLLNAWYPVSIRNAIILLIGIICLTVIEAKILTIANKELFFKKRESS